MASCTREPNGNVVVRSGRFAWRHFIDSGGAPNEVWYEPFPLISNPYRGSGFSVNCEVGQDPTQASTNGNLARYTSTLTVPDYYPWEGFYLKEYLFDPAGHYGVKGVFSDFLLSAEAIDDAIAPDKYSLDSGFRTKYQPGEYFVRLNSPDCPIIFKSNPGNISGIIFVGNEMIPMSQPWATRLRRYEKGRICARQKISMKYAGPGSICGILFRKDVLAYAYSKDEAYLARGYSLNIDYDGRYEVRKRPQYNSPESLITAGTLTRDELKLLKSDYGIEVEIRTYVNDPRKVDIFFNRNKKPPAYDYGEPVLGPHFGYFCQCPVVGSYILIGDRAPCDMNLIMTMSYQALGDNERIQTRIKIETVDIPIKFYRANTPAIFLNQETFKPGNRRTTLIPFNNAPLIEAEGVFNLDDYKAFYCGNNEGTAGVQAIPLIYTIDGQHSSRAHVLLQKSAYNDEFVLMLNPLPPNAEMEISELYMVVEWRPTLI